MNMSQAIKNKKIDVNAIWISDLHLGSKGCQTKKLNSFLDSINCNQLFLVGDIIDNWLIKKNQKLPIEHEIIIDKFVLLSQRGVKITYLPGNHDSNYRNEDKFFSFPIQDELTYTAIDNKKYLVFHGDQIDNSMYGKSIYLSRLGGFLYEACLIGRSVFQKFSKNNGTSSGFTRWLKITIKNIFSKFYKYEKRLLSYLDQKNVDGVICGHSHQPKITKIKHKDYLNSGDWIDNCSYIIEDHNGKFSLENWTEG
ncbi:MAG: hypothetical protein CMP39_06565 [Rickettsiales bacterium]|nr:hypothetical protein [Rickettsiales bacterium]|tara:strand:- start:1887 stop:2645 length:759 start_codon:yes stop_codon:yes gene_type:complete